MESGALSQSEAILSQLKRLCVRENLGGWGPEAIQFMKTICNKFPPDISCKLKHKWKIIISTFVKRGQRYATEKVKHQLSYDKDALPYPVMS